MHPALYFWVMSIELMIYYSVFPPDKTYITGYGMTIIKDLLGVYSQEQIYMKISSEY